jgi:hypothetical protein
MNEVDDHDVGKKKEEQQRTFHHKIPMYVRFGCEWDFSNSIKIGGVVVVVVCY